MKNYDGCNELKKLIIKKSQGKKLQIKKHTSEDMDNDYDHSVG